MSDIRRWIALCEAEQQPILYHGSDDRFDMHSTQGTSYLGIYYSADKEYAKTFGKNLKAAHIILHHPFLINMDDRQSPHYASTHGEIVIDGRIEGFYRKLTPETIETLKNHGYDGIMAEYKGNPYFEVVAFEPSQVHELSH